MRRLFGITCLALSGCSRPDTVPPSRNLAIALAEVQAWLPIGFPKSDVPRILQGHGFTRDDRVVSGLASGTNDFTALTFRYRHGFFFSGTDLRLTVHFYRDRVSTMGLRADPFGLGH